VRQRPRPKISCGKRLIDAPPRPVAANDNVQGATKPSRFKLSWSDDIADEAPKETIIKGIFGVNEFTTVIGQPGAGKSVIITNMAAHVAAGMEWHGRRVKQGLVVYVAAERREVTERRLLAFRKRHVVTDVPLLVLGGHINLVRDMADARDIATAIRAAEIESGHKLCMGDYRHPHPHVWRGRPEHGQGHGQVCLVMR